jgi:hypothetical protein
METQTPRLEISFSRSSGHDACAVYHNLERWIFGGHLGKRFHASVRGCHFVQFLPIPAREDHLVPQFCEKPPLGPGQYRTRHPNQNRVSGYLHTASLTQKIEIAFVLLTSSPR